MGISKINNDGVPMSPFRCRLRLCYLVIYLRLSKTENVKIVCTNFKNLKIYKISSFYNYQVYEFYCNEFHHCTWVKFFKLDFLNDQFGKV